MTRDPMLDGIARYSHGRTMHTDKHGSWVSFRDIPALIARVREDERGRSHPAYAHGFDVGREQGQRDEREACIDTVWLVRDEKGYSNPEWQKRIVAAIRARSDGGES